MDVIIAPIFTVADILLDLYFWVLLLSIILSWLLAFGVINTHNPFVTNFGQFLFKLTEPALAPIRRFLPNLGGIDISPIFLMIAIWFLQDVLRRLVLKLFAVI